MTTKKSARYSVPTDEDFEPNSNNEVLKNKLGITTKDKMDLLEEQELKHTESEVMTLIVFDENYRFTAQDICDIHEFWLKDIYFFAGKYRTVNMAKEDFTFAASNRIEPLMNTLERDYLAKYTPCHFTDTLILAEALGIVHVELIIIHPFREGNGRVARLLADLMAMQAKRQPLNYALIDQTNNMEGFNNYIKAIHAGFNGDYKPITEIFKKLLDQSI